MAGDTIHGRDIFDDDVLARIEQVSVALKNVSNTIKNDVEGSIKSLNKNKLNSAESIKEANKEIKDLADNTKKLAQAEAALLKVEQEEERLKQAKLKTAKEESKSQKEANKEKEKEIRLAKDAANIYKQQSARLNELRNQYKNLALQNRENTTEAKKLLKEITALDTKLKRVDANVGQFQRNVGNYGGALKSLSGVLGTLGVGFSIGSIFKDAIEASTAFEKSIQNLSAITGASGKDLEFYKEKARELGLTTKGGAVAVVEAFKLIGSAKPELLKNKDALAEVTNQAILLSKAAGLELPDAATRLTDALNQFGAPASQAAKYVDILAAASQAGAAEVPDITEALLKFGVAAKSSNITIQESAAAIEVLAEKGLKGAEAGTALRNIFAKLSATKVLPPEAKFELEKAGVNLKKLEDKTIPLNERLKELSKIQGNAAAITRVFGLENKNAAEAIITSLPRLEELTKAVDTNGVAMQQAATNTDTFDQKMIEAKNGYNDLLLEISDGDFSVITKGFIDAVIEQFEFLKNEFKSVGILFKEGFSGLENFGNKLGESSALKVFRADAKKLSEENKKAKIEELTALRQFDLDKLNSQEKLSKEEILNLQKGIEIRTKFLAILTNTEVNLEEQKNEKISNIQDDATSKSERKLEDKRKKKEKESEDDLAAAIKEAERLGEEEARIEQERLKRQLEDEKKVRQANQIQIDADEDARKLAEEWFDRDAAEKKQKKEKEIQELKAQLGKTLDLIEQELQRESQLKQDALDKDIDRRQQSIETQRNLAERGLENTLAFEEEELAKTQLRKEEEKKKEIRQQKAINFLKSYGAYLDNGKNASEALTRAITDQVIVETISAAFYEGTQGKNVAEDIGAPHLSGKDGYIIRVDGQEKVFNPADSKLIGNMSNHDVAMLAKAHQDNAYLPSIAMNMELGSSAKQMGDSASLMQLVNMNKKLDSLEKTISNKRETNIHLDNLGNVITNDIEGGFRKFLKIKRNLPRI